MFTISPRTALQTFNSFLGFAHPQILDHVVLKLDVKFSSLKIGMCGTIFAEFTPYSKSKTGRFNWVILFGYRTFGLVVALLQTFNVECFWAQKWIVTCYCTELEISNTTVLSCEAVLFQDVGEYPWPKQRASHEWTKISKYCASLLVDCLESEIIRQLSSWQMYGIFVNT